MNPNSKFDSMVEKIELWTVIISILVLSLAYDGYFQTPNAPVEALKRFNSNQ